MRVDVYRNLRAKDDITWSIRATDTREQCKPFYGKVIAHATHVILNDASFKVGQKGRQRVLDTKQKNVHAFVRGNLSEAYITLDPLGIISSTMLTSSKVKNGFSYQQMKYSTRVYYDPYKWDSFVMADGTPVETADKVWLRTSGEVYAYNKPTDANSLPTWC